jgi:hypothetical protein
LAIFLILVDKTPDQLKLPFVLWSREALQMYCEDHCGVRTALRTISEYLKRWGFTPQKPLKKAYAQDPQKVREWLDKDYRALHAMTKKKKRTFTGEMKPEFRLTLTGRAVKKWLSTHQEEIEVFIFPLILRS